jgi:hypothetical protein
MCTYFSFPSNKSLSSIALGNFGRIFSIPSLLVVILICEEWGKNGVLRH